MNRNEKNHSNSFKISQFTPEALNIIETSLVFSDVEHAEAQAEKTSLSCVQFMHLVQEKHKEEEHVMK
jgi:hypothetical protein